MNLEKHVALLSMASVVALADVPSVSYADSNSSAGKCSLPLIQLIDADGVNAEGSLAFKAPFDRPNDWTVSGDPKLLARFLGHLVTDAGLKEVATYADGIGPRKHYNVSTVARARRQTPALARCFRQKRPEHRANAESSLSYAGRRLGTQRSDATR